MSDRFSEYKDFDSTNFFLFLIAWRKPLVIISVIAMVASIIFSAPFFIPPKYKATVIMYPTSTSSVSKALLSDTYGGKEDILEFGEDEQTEQMLQILNSNKIRDRVVSKYDLFAHYNIGAESKYRYTRLIKEYESNIKFRRTEYNAVKITVNDKDPQVAADIANDIADLLDSIKIGMQRERAIKGFLIVEGEYLQLKQEIQVMEDSLTVLRGLGVHDYESQAEMINQQLAIEIAKNNQSGIKALDIKLEVLAKYGGPYVSLRDALEHEKKQLSLLKTKYAEAKVDAEEELPQKFVVSSAYKAEKKSYPIRWLIVLVTTLAAFMFAVLVIIIIENINKSQLVSIKKKKLINFNLRVSPEKKAKIIHINKNGLKNWISNVNIINSMENYFSNISLISLILKWKWHIGVIIFVAGLLSAIFSGPVFITPKFKSIGVIYPSNIAPYSEESETEQMVQWLNAIDIKDSIIEKFNLSEHYKIDPAYKYFYSTLLNKYSKHVKISKTMYESVEIEVLDKNPQVACDMVNAIIYYFNMKVRGIHRAKYDEVVRIAEKLLELKRQELDTAAAKLYNIRTQYEIIDYGHQAREVSRGFLGTVDGNNAAKNINMPEVIKLKKNLEEMGGEFVINNTRLYDILRLYSDLEKEYELAFYDANKEFTYTNIVSHPVVADKKSSPVRWLIVFYTVIISLFFSLVVIIYVENKQHIQHDIKAK